MSERLKGEPVFSIGDRIELYAPTDALRQAQLPLDPALNSFLTKPDLGLFIETVQGTLPIEHDPGRGILQSPVLPELAKTPGTLVLDCLSTQPWRFRLRMEPAADVRLPVTSLTTEQGVALAFAEEDTALLRNDRLALACLRDFRLSLQAARLGIVAGFDQLLSLPWLHEVELLEHQLRTARTALRRLRGRALLCDEVGLGKTIEAGIILLELIARGLVRRVLVLTPPALVEQWQGEMRRKFGDGAEE